MIIAIEIDKIISTPIPSLFRLGDAEKCSVLPGAKEALETLKALNQTIFIYTKRDVSLGRETEIWLKKNKIPYDRIMFSKPEYDIMLDTQSYKFQDWKAFFKKYQAVLNAR